MVAGENISVYRGIPQWPKANIGTDWSHAEVCCVWLQSTVPQPVDQSLDGHFCNVEKYSVSNPGVWNMACGLDPACSPGHPDAGFCPSSGCSGGTSCDSSQHPGESNTVGKNPATLVKTEENVWAGSGCGVVLLSFSCPGCHCGVGCALEAPPPCLQWHWGCQCPSFPGSWPATMRTHSATWVASAQLTGVLAAFMRSLSIMGRALVVAGTKGLLPAVLLEMSMPLHKARVRLSLGKPYHHWHSQSSGHGDGASDHGAAGVACTLVKAGALALARSPATLGLSLSHTQPSVPEGPFTATVALQSSSCVCIPPSPYALYPCRVIHALVLELLPVVVLGLKWTGCGLPAPERDGMWPSDFSSHLCSKLCCESALKGGLFSHLPLPRFSTEHSSARPGIQPIIFIQYQSTIKHQDSIQQAFTGMMFCSYVAV